VGDVTDDRALSPGCLACVRKEGWRVCNDVFFVVSVNLFTCYACVVVNDVVGYVNIDALRVLTSDRELS
jgi:hypothetical protein